MKPFAWRQCLSALFCACALALPVVSVAADANATQATGHAQSRDEDAAVALKERRYDRVIVITKRVALTNPGSASNWYRMAIASARLGDYDVASTALKEAQKIDPSLKFASTPERVSKLQSDINAGLNTSMPIPAPAPVAIAIAPKPTPLVQPTPVESDDQIDPSATRATAAESAVTAAMEKMETHLTTLEKMVAVLTAGQQSAPSSGSQVQTTIAIYATGFAVVSLSFGLLLAYALRKQTTKLQQAKVRDVVTMPLDELITFNRDNSFVLMERLVLHGHKETALYQSLVRSLISLEQESGKSRIDVKSIVNRVALPDTEKTLDPKPMVLGKDDSKHLHQSAASAALARSTQLARA